MSNSSLPALFETRMQQQLGKHYQAFRESLVVKAPVSIRLNPYKELPETQQEPVPWTTHGRYLKERPVFTLDPAFHAGAYYVQEASSMFLEQAVRHTIDLTQPILALDLCAAPGGKSTHLISLLSEESLVVSNEVIRSRATILSENLQKWGNANSIVTNNDPQDFSDVEGVFDLIVVDAPCSGEGLFRKDPEAISEWSEENVLLCSQRQRRILSDVWPALKSGGILLYSTCTYNAEENEENLRWLQEQKDIEFISIPLDKNWGVEETKLGSVIGYRFFPHQVKGEGFFISAIRKKGEQHSINFNRGRTSFTFLSEKKKSIIKNWIQQYHQFELIEQQELTILIPQRWKEEINWFSQHLKVMTKGTALATFKHDKPIPEHAFALSHQLNKQELIQHELTLIDAQHYLKKDVLNFPSEKKGFQLVTFQQLTLGWINHLGNRINNLYPTAWRIKMEVGAH